MAESEGHGEARRFAHWRAHGRCRRCCSCSITITKRTAIRTCAGSMCSWPKAIYGSNSSSPFPASSWFMCMQRGAVPLFRIPESTAGAALSAASVHAAADAGDGAVLPLAGGARALHLYLRCARLSPLHQLLELHRQPVSGAGMAPVSAAVVERRFVVRERGVVPVPHLPDLFVDRAAAPLGGRWIDRVRFRAAAAADPATDRTRHHL